MTLVEGGASRRQGRAGAAVGPPVVGGEAVVAGAGPVAGSGGAVLEGDAVVVGLEGLRPGNPPAPQPTPALRSGPGGPASGQTSTRPGAGVGAGVDVGDPGCVDVGVGVRGGAGAGVGVGAEVGRLASLDVLRGLTVAGMILVENQGSGAHAFPGMSHARWHGFNGADLVFPAFLFIMGASMAYALRPGRPGVRRKVVRRAAVLFGLGLLLNAFPRFDLADLRVMGVLQRIGLVSLLAALLVLHAPVRKQVRVAAVILLAYWAMLLLPVPGHPAGTLSPTLNVAGAVDRDVLGPTHVYKNGGYDPEGLLSTLPAVVTVLAGYWTARHVKRQSMPHGSPCHLTPIATRQAVPLGSTGQMAPGATRQAVPLGGVRHVAASARRRFLSCGTSCQLAVTGAACVAAGLAWSGLLPINKRLWTSSFVVLTAGLSLLLFALCYELIEVRGRRRLGWWASVFGMNAIVVYVASEQVGHWLDVVGWRSWIYRTVFDGVGLHVGSLLYGVAFTGCWWAVCWVLWRRRIFVKI